jgi:hypothetical protein
MDSVDGDVLILVMDMRLIIPILAHQSMDLVQEFLDTPNATLATTNFDVLR